MIQFLVRSLQSLRAEIDQRDRQIRKAHEALPEAQVISSLPGAGYTVTNGSVHLVTATGDEPELAEPELLTGTEG